MLKKIEAAYKEYRDKYKRTPDYIVLNYQNFNDVMKESFENSDPAFLGMQHIVISDENIGFDLYEKWELDYVLAKYEKDSPKMENFSVFRSIPPQIIRRNPESNQKIPSQSGGDSIEIDYKTIRAYQRHLELIKNGQTNK